MKPFIEIKSSGKVPRGVAAAKKLFSVFIILACLSLLVCADTAGAATANVLDAQAEDTLTLFKDTKGSDAVLKKAAGLLVFPSILKGGFGIGAEYGEGVLLEDGATKGYYNTIGGSWGFQIGLQKKSMIIAFMDKGALSRFENSSGWKVGADASVAVIAVGVDGSIDTSKLNQPIVAFVFDQQGLMYNLTLEGTKITKIHK